MKIFNFGITGLCKIVIIDSSVKMKNKNPPHCFSNKDLKGTAVD